MIQRPHQQQRPELACTAEDTALARARLQRILSDPTTRPLERIRASRMLAEIDERADQPDRTEHNGRHSPAF